MKSVTDNCSMRPLKRLLPFGAKLWVKETVTTLFNIPFSRFGVPVALMEAFPRSQPITLLDLGASQGMFTESMDRYCGVKKALLVEPQPKRVSEMKAKFSGKPFSIECAAVSSEEGLVEMEVLNWDFSSSILPVRRDIQPFATKVDLGIRERIQVRTATLDDLCDRAGFDGFIDLLKIDVQGAESLVITGASNTLRRVGLIWIELSVQPMYSGMMTFESMIHLCSERGFILKRLEECFHGSNGELLAVDALFAPQTPRVT